MDSSASDSPKEIYIHHLLIHTQKKTHKNDYYSCEHFVTILFHNFSQVIKFKGKANSKNAYVLKTVMGLFAVAVIRKEQ